MDYLGREEDGKIVKSSAKAQSFVIVKREETMEQKNKIQKSWIRLVINGKIFSSEWFCFLIR